MIGRFLSREDVVLGLSATDKRGALEEIALLVGRNHQLDHTLVFRALWRREQSASTGLGHGVAIPHARIPGIREAIVAFARTTLPIPFGAPDHQPVSSFFVILVPEHANEEHLQILATVSELFSSNSFRDRLEATADPAEIQRLFREWATDDDSRSMK
jgi:nitrogen PTS system EIIA component